MSDHNTPPHDPRQVLAWARYYASFGLIVVPVKKQSKQPSMGQGWQLNKDNIINIGFLNKNHNLGIMVGASSNGYVDIDLDCYDAIEIAPWFLPQTSTFGRKTSPTSHYCYFVTVPEGIDLKVTLENYKRAYALPDIGTIAEFRSGKGSQTVHPPSVHADTREFIHWDNEDPMENMTTLPASELFIAFSKVVAMVIAAKFIIPGILHHGSLHLIGALYHLGWSIEAVEHFVECLIVRTAMHDPEDRRKCIYDTFTKGTEYHQNIGGFGELVRVFDQSGQDGKAIVTALRRVLEPTGEGEGKRLTPAEVFSRCDNIKTAMSGFMDVTAVQAPPAELLNSGEIAQPTLPLLPGTDPLQNPVNAPPAELLSPGIQMLDAPTQVIASDIEISLQDELARTNNLTFNYLIENLLPAKELGFVFGDSGTYKTYLILDILLSMSYLDHWATRRIAPAFGDVLLVTGEGRNTIGDRVRVWMQDQKIDGTVVPRHNIFIYDNYMDLFDDPRRDLLAKDAMSEFEQYLKQRPNVDLVVFDTWSSLFSGDENSSKDVAPTLKRMKELCEQYHVGMLVVHHKGKSGQSYRGSGALTANSDFNYDISKELDEDDEPTGRIIFEDRQQRSSASSMLSIFKPRVLLVHGRQTNFGEPLKNVVMDIQTDKVKPKRHKTGIALLLGRYRDEQLEWLRDIVASFKILKTGDPQYVTGGLTMEQLYACVKSQRLLRGTDCKRIDNFSRLLISFCEKKIMRYKQEGSAPAVNYYYIEALTHVQLASLDNKNVDIFS